MMCPSRQVDSLADNAFPAFLSSDFFFKMNFSEKFFQEDDQSIKRSVGPDLGPNCLNRLSADDASR